MLRSTSGLGSLHALPKLKQKLSLTAGVCRTLQQQNPAILPRRTPFHSLYLQPSSMAHRATDITLPSILDVNRAAIARYHSRHCTGEDFHILPHTCGPTTMTDTIRTLPQALCTALSTQRSSTDMARVETLATTGVRESTIMKNLLYHSKAGASPSTTIDLKRELQKGRRAQQRISSALLQLSSYR